jgi:CheY-like chemotaxis protein
MDAPRSAVGYRNRQTVRPSDRRRALAQPTAAPAARRRARIVVGDHDQDRRDAAVGALAQLGNLDVCAAVTGTADVMATVASVRPDGVLLITDMPELTHLATMAELRSVHPELPVTLMVGVAAECFHRVEAFPLLAGLRALIDPDSTMPYQRIAVVLVPAELTSPRTARRFLVSTLEAWNLEPLCSGAELVVSELVSNAVLHATSPAQITVGQIDDRSIRIEVKDWGLGDLVRRPGSSQDTSGRGLRLIDGLTGRWGSSSHLGERSVWCDLRVD